MPPLHYCLNLQDIQSAQSRIRARSTPCLSSTSLNFVIPFENDKQKVSREGPDLFAKGQEGLQNGSIVNDRLNLASKRKNASHVSHGQSNVDMTLEVVPNLHLSSNSSSKNDCTIQINVLFKAEMFQRTGSFKFRGASNAVALLPKSVKVVATVSSGNFAQALTLAAKEANLESVIVMPKDTTPVKVQAVRGFGGKVVFCEPNKRDETLAQVVADLGPSAKAVHPSDDPHVIAGQGTVFLEFSQQAKIFFGGNPLDVVFVPVGGGGVISGVAMAANGTGTLVVGAEPEIADDAFRSKKLGTIQGHRNNRVPTTVAEGLRTTLGPNTFPIVHDLVDHIVPVSEQEIITATRLLMERLKVVVEPSSATAYAALRHPETAKWLAARFPNRSSIRVGCILTGGNVDFSTMWKL